MSILLTNALNNAASELDRVRNDLYYVDSSKIHYSSIVRDRSAGMIASSYVWMAAIMEAFLKSSLESLVSEINTTAIPYSQLKMRLFALACAPEFASLQDIRGLNMWNRRVDLLNRLAETATATLSLKALPIDGRTIRPEHLDTVWNVFEIPGNSTPGPRHRIALTDLADGRNSVAHGETDPIRFGRSKVTSDVLRTVNYIEDIVIHTSDALSNYLKNRQYLR